MPTADPSATALAAVHCIESARTIHRTIVEGFGTGQQLKIWAETLVEQMSAAIYRRIELVSRLKALVPSFDYSGRHLDEVGKQLMLISARLMKEKGTMKRIDLRSALRSTRQHPVSGWDGNLHRT